MKIKCKICGQKGFYSETKVAEYWASRFIFVILKKKNTSCYVCRDCLKRILNSLQLEQYMIERLYQPEIKQEG